MSQLLKETCAKNVNLQRYIRSRAVRVFRHYRNVLEVDDIVNDMWVRVFEAIDKRYDSQSDVIYFARQVVFSYNGNRMPDHGMRKRNNQLSWDNDVISYYEPVNPHAVNLEQHIDKLADGKTVDVADILHEKMTLEAIRKELENQYSKNRVYRIVAQHYKLAAQHLEYSLQGGTSVGFATEMNVPVMTAYNAWKKVKQIASKYEEVIV